MPAGADGARGAGSAPALRLDSVATVDISVRGERGVILAAGVDEFSDLLRTAAELRARVSRACVQQPLAEGAEEVAAATARAQSERRAATEAATAAAAAAKAAEAAAAAAPRFPQTLPYDPPSPQPQPPQPARVAPAAHAPPPALARARAPTAAADTLSIVGARIAWDEAQGCARLQAEGEGATHALTIRVLYEAQLQPRPPLPARALRLEATVTLGIRVESPSVTVESPPPSAQRDAGARDVSSPAAGARGAPAVAPVRVARAQVCEMLLSNVAFQGMAVQPAVLPALLTPLREMRAAERRAQAGEAASRGGAVDEAGGASTPGMDAGMDAGMGVGADTDADADAARLVAAIVAMLADGCAPSRAAAGSFVSSDGLDWISAPDQSAAAAAAESALAAAPPSARAARAFAVAASVQSELLGLGQSLTAGARFEPTLGALQRDVKLTGLLGETLASSTAQLRVVLRAARVAASVLRQQADTLASVTGGRDELDADNDLEPRNLAQPLAQLGGALDLDAPRGGQQGSPLASTRGGASADRAAVGTGGGLNGQSDARTRTVASVTLPRPGRALTAAGSQVVTSAAAAASMLQRGAASRVPGRQCSCAIEELSEERLQFVWALRLSSPRAVRLRVRLDCELHPTTCLVRSIALHDARLNGAPLLPDAARELGGWLQEWQLWGADVDASSPAAEQLALRLLRLVDQIAGGA